MNFSVRIFIEAVLRGLRLLSLQACDEAMARHRDQIAAKKRSVSQPATGATDDKAEQ